MGQSIRDVRGGTYIDGLRMKLDCTDLVGDVHIRNCFGTTRYSKRSQQASDKARLITDSGKIEIMLKEDLIGEINVTAISVAGAIRYEALAPLGALRICNDMTLMTVSTILTPDTNLVSPMAMAADILAQCREGDITIDKMV